MSFTVELVGMRELEQNLKQLPKAIKRRVALNALRKGGEPIAKMARALAPVEQGNLREGINVLATLSRSQAADKGSVAPVEMYVGAGQHPQAITQEFGTWFHPAQPFLRPAWESQRMTALDLIGAHLGLEIDKAANRLSKKALQAYGKGKRR